MEEDDVSFSTSLRGNKLLHHNGQKYIKNNIYGKQTYWKCSRWHGGCKARAITYQCEPATVVIKNIHNHF